MIDILVPLDGSTVAEEALKHALRIARTFPAKITLVRVLGGDGSGAPLSADSVDIALRRYQAQAYFRGLVAKYGIRPEDVAFKVLEGQPAESVINCLHETRSDLLVLTRFGRGNATGFSAGGTAQKIISRANCSILLLDPHLSIDSRQPYRRILVPVDDSRNSDVAVAVAAMMAKVNETSLILLHVLEEPRLPRGLPATPHARQLVREMQGLMLREADRRLAQLARAVPPEIGVETRAVVVPESSLVIESVAEEENCDMLVLHTGGEFLDEAEPRTAHRFESLNQSLIQNSHRPLFVLQPAAEEGLSSRYRCVFLDEQRVQ